MQYGVLSSRARLANKGAARLFAVRRPDSAQQQAYAAVAPAPTVSIAHREVHVHWLHSEQVGNLGPAWQQQSAPAAVE